MPQLARLNGGVPLLGLWVLIHWHRTHWSSTWWQNMQKILLVVILFIEKRNTADFETWRCHSSGSHLHSSSRDSIPGGLLTLLKALEVFTHHAADSPLKIGGKGTPEIPRSLYRSLHLHSTLPHFFHCKWPRWQLNSWPSPEIARWSGWAMVCYDGQSCLAHFQAAQT